MTYNVFGVTLNPTLLLLLLRSSLHTSRNGNIFLPHTERQIRDHALYRSTSCMESATDRTETHVIVVNNF